MCVGHLAQKKNDEIERNKVNVQDQERGLEGDPSPSLPPSLSSPLVIPSLSSSIYIYIYICLVTFICVLVYIPILSQISIRVEAPPRVVIEVMLPESSQMVPQSGVYNSWSYSCLSPLALGYRSDIFFLSFFLISSLLFLSI